MRCIWQCKSIVWCGACRRLIEIIDWMLDVLKRWKILSSTVTFRGEWLRLFFLTVTCIPHKIMMYCYIIPCLNKMRPFDWFLSLQYNVVQHAKKLYSMLPQKQCHKNEKNITYFCNIMTFAEFEVLLWCQFLSDLDILCTIETWRNFSFKWFMVCLNQASIDATGTVSSWQKNCNIMKKINFFFWLLWIWYGIKP